MALRTKVQSVKNMKKFNLFILILILAICVYFTRYFLMFKIEDYDLEKMDSIEKFEKILIKKSSVTTITEESNKFDVNNEIEEDENDSNANPYDIDRIRQLPVLFILGHPRSGTTIVRSILDVHPSIFCGPETKIFPSILTHLEQFESLAIEKNFEYKAYFSFKKLYDATALFMFHFLNNQMQKSNILCAHDPHMFQHILTLNKLFPKAKFIYMIRDGRASVHSLMKFLNKTITKDTFYFYLNRWNTWSANANEQCEKVGKQVCQMLKYEDLILKPEMSLKQILVPFLNISYVDEFLHHEKFIGTKVIIERNGWSSNQVNKSIYADSLHAWKGQVEYDEKNISSTIYMLKKFGYQI